MATRLTQDRVYVFTKSPEGDDCLAGELHSQGTSGTFRYSQAYLDCAWSYPLDPANLPLSPQVFTVTNKHGVFGVFTDAGPDDWGTRIMLMDNTHTPQNELERLVRTSGGGVGCLQFSLSRSRPKSPKPLKHISLLEQLHGVTKRILDREVLSADELALIEPGSFLGGARPKVSVVDDTGQVWMVKFPKQSDPFDYCAMEHACMRFIQHAFGIQIPEVKLIDLPEGETLFAVKRFDKIPGRPVHFISANSLFNVDRVRPVNDSRHNPYSYVNLATALRKYSSRDEDVRELFTRMVANILVGNTDDHANNHAVTYDLHSRSWQLSPAYDVLPSLTGQLQRQSLGVGLFGGVSTLDNALSLSHLFGLPKPKAEDFIKGMVEKALQWREFAINLQLDNQSIQWVENIITSRGSTANK